MIHIAICWIGIGNYKVLWDDFYKSFYKNFCNEPNIKRTFFIFTDDKEYFKDYNTNTIIYEIQNLTKNITRDFILYRKFKFLLYAEDQFLSYDYIAFINGNGECIQKINFNDIFINNKITCITHPCNTLITHKKLSCNNVQSAAYFNVPSNMQIKYKQAGFICCNIHDFLRMSQQIEIWRQIDKINNQTHTVRWHDETYYNKYLYCFCKDKLHILDGKIWFSPKMHDNVKIFSRDKNIVFNKFNLELNLRTHRDIY